MVFKPLTISSKYFSLSFVLNLFFCRLAAGMLTTGVRGAAELAGMRALTVALASTPMGGAPSEQAAATSAAALPAWSRVGMPRAKASS